MSRDRRDREQGGSVTLQTIASSGDRVREFKRAGRHSWIVRFFKLALPTFAVVVIAGYGLSLLAVSGFKSKGVSVEAVKIDTENLTMDAPKYVGFGKDGERFEVRAKEAITDLKQTAPVRLNYIDGDITQKTGVVTKLKARWGTYDQKKEILELYESIHVDGSTGMKARLTRATIFTKENHIISNEPIYAETDTGNIRADTMDMHSKQHQVVFRNNVHVHLKGNASANAAAPAPTAAKAKQAAPLPGLTANSGQPIEVKSEQLDVDDTAKTALFRRSVIARQGDATLQSPELDVFYEGKANLGEAPVLRQADEPAKAADDATKLRMIKARGGVILTNKDDRADGDTLDYDAKLDKATLRGNVTLTSTNERKATAKIAEFDQKADTALLLGDVIVVQGRNTMRSRRLFMDRKAGKTRLDSPALDGQAAGRINTVFYQNTAKTDPAKAAKGSEPAQGNPIFGAQFKTDPNAPVDVTSDTLDVLDTAKTAIYRGEVIAKQGDFVVRTAEMTAFYTGQAGLMSAGAAPPKPDPAKADPAGANAQGAQLTRIEARQKVVVTSKDGQSAVGDWADFDVKANKCVIGGRVIVSQGKSVVEGTRLVIDMTTGQSHFEQSDTGPPTQSDQKIPGIAALKSSTGSPSAAAVVGTAISSAVSGGSVTCPPGVICSDGVIRSKQRVRAVLWPEEAKAKAKQKADEVLGTSGGANVAAKKDKSAKTDKPASAPPGWEATSQPAVNAR